MAFSIDIDDTADGLAYAITHRWDRMDGVERKVIKQAYHDLHKVMTASRTRPDDDAAEEMQRKLLIATATQIQRMAWPMLAGKGEPLNLDLLEERFRLAGKRFVEAELLYDALTRLDDHLLCQNSANPLKGNAQWQNIRRMVRENDVLRLRAEQARELLGEYNGVGDLEILHHALPAIVREIKEEGKITQDQIVSRDRGRGEGEGGTYYGAAGTLRQLKKALETIDAAQEMGIDMALMRHHVRDGVLAVREAVAQAPRSALSESAIRKGDSFIERLLAFGRKSEEMPATAAAPRFDSHFIAQLRQLCDQLDIPPLPREQAHSGKLEL